MGYRAVVFDLVGTLVDLSGEDLMALHSRVAAGMSLPLDRFLDLWSAEYERLSLGEHASALEAIEQVATRAGVTLVPEQARAFELEWPEFMRASLRSLWPDALPVLRQIRDAGYRTGLITNCPPDIPALWPESDLAPLIDVAVFSSEAGLRKPDPRIYQLACRELGVEPEECVFVGDGGSSEISGAAAAGMFAVQLRAPVDAVTAGILAQEDWDGRTVSTLSELLSIVTARASTGPEACPEHE
jgi:putative hydrolase of the HAD superfamily